MRSCMRASCCEDKTARSSLPNHVMRHVKARGSSMCAHSTQNKPVPPYMVYLTMHSVPPWPRDNLTPDKPHSFKECGDHRTKDVVHSMGHVCQSCECLHACLCAYILPHQAQVWLPSLFILRLQPLLLSLGTPGSKVSLKLHQHMMVCMHVEDIEQTHHTECTETVAPGPPL